MIIIGILGGVASGKSLVTSQLQELGAERIDADRLGHEVLREAEIKAAVRDYWGSDVFVNEEIDRSSLARRVFAPAPAGPVALAHLEKLTHPRIGERIRERIADLRAAGVPAVVLDAPVMLKAGWAEHCDVLVFVDANREWRRQRAMSRGWSSDEFEAREAAQEPCDLKRRRSDVIVDNNGTIQAIKQQVQSLWDEWTANARSSPQAIVTPTATRPDRNELC